MICPKCEYQRNSYDRSPEWQCPSCGVVYQKYESIKEEMIAQRERWKQEDQDVEQRIASFRPFANLCFILCFSYPIYFLLASKSSLGVIWPIILGVSLIFLCKNMIATGIFIRRGFIFTPREKYPTYFKIELITVVSGGLWLLYAGFSNFFRATW
ncbi:hypothetical protein ACJJIR_16815 [Microbulbifer sp. SSSA008]|uniref:hypothetical protein n=1 Tax=Microbulbifer sp. SSSA008 TaxID=3243380 RepID=UPI00403A51EA